MAQAVYILCAVTSLACAVLLFRGYLRARGARFLLWSSLCFVGLALNNVMLFVDRVLLPDQNELLGVSFAIWRSAPAAAGMLLLLYGLIWDAE